jgi:predicted histidine transporter YuiF (NhaC family)
MIYSLILFILSLHSVAGGVITVKPRSTILPATEPHNEISTVSNGLTPISILLIILLSASALIVGLSLAVMTFRRNRNKSQAKTRIEIKRKEMKLEVEKIESRIVWTG